MKGRDKAIAELEKTLLTEKRKTETVEGQLKETAAKLEAEISGMAETIFSLRGQCSSAHHELLSARQELEVVTSAAGSRKQTLLQQIADHQAMLLRVSEQFSLLSSSTSPKNSYEQLRVETIAFQLQIARYSRRLGTTEAQVSEPANLIRQTQEENDLLRCSVTDMEQELTFYHEHFALQNAPQPVYTALEDSLRKMERDWADFQEDVAEIIAENTRLDAEFCHLQHLDLLCAHAHLETTLCEFATIVAKLPEIERQRDTAQDILQATTVSLKNLRVSSESFKRQAVELQARVEAEARRRIMFITVQKSRMAEDSLRAENEQLAKELERLSGRNSLAEGEAQRLRKANAEILGHQNPAQKIMYVERIRNELTETKQQLLNSTRAIENLTTHQLDLQTELDLYKSVAILKPGTKFTRMKRPPLVDLNHSCHVLSLAHTDRLTHYWS
ncbi:hypothetical protein D9757_004326 [Collybiopsis confluens]|uniref:Uncharacterized protein n=1 Tax=Collybiopsis confluens TaxID=2823264 RepID=A0A8H5HU45_9AGAR|nr:hypothetical protein D9757_004326 [Collybiopsis confluens]